jgi:hypothetical protein
MEVSLLVLPLSFSAKLKYIKAMIKLTLLGAVCFLVLLQIKFDLWR